MRERVGGLLLGALGRGHGMIDAERTMAETVCAEVADGTGEYERT